MGRAFPTPFAKPPGRRLSSPVVNVLWGALNLVVSYLLVHRVGSFNGRATADILPLTLGGALTGLLLARSFGRLRDGCERRNGKATARKRAFSKPHDNPAGPSA